MRCGIPVLLLICLPWWGLQAGNGVPVGNGGDSLRVCFQEAHQDAQRALDNLTILPPLSRQDAPALRDHDQEVRHLYQDKFRQQVLEALRQLAFDLVDNDGSELIFSARDQADTGKTLLLLSRPYLQRNPVNRQAAFIFMIKQGGLAAGLRDQALLENLGYRLLWAAIKKEVVPGLNLMDFPDYLDTGAKLIISRWELGQ